jgi:virginiamycin B lyase
MWFTEQDANAIGRISMRRVITEFGLPKEKGTPVGIASSPDGAMWFTEHAANEIGRITTTGAMTQFPVRTPRGRDIEAACGQLKTAAERKSRAEIDRLAEDKQAALG